MSGFDDSQGRAASRGEARTDGEKEMALCAQRQRKPDLFAFDAEKNFLAPYVQSQVPAAANLVRVQQEGSHLLLQMRLSRRPMEHWQVIASDLSKHLATRAVGLSTGGVSQLIGDVLVSFGALNGEAHVVQPQPPIGSLGPARQEPSPFGQSTPIPPGSDYDDVMFAFSLSPVGVTIGRDKAGPQLVLGTKFEVLQPRSGPSTLRATGNLALQLPNVTLSAQVTQDATQGRSTPRPQFMLGAKFQF